ncbi:MAG: helicase-exonuclease AddAB subunit AddA [Eubacteriales bacterium]
MAEIKLTPSQQAVVDHRGGALLVSAAAGSGKTKVLVDRLLRQVCDRENPRNIQDFLIITYTKAAASELQQKIAKELGKLLIKNPHNLHLQRQMRYIYAAEISTIHAFCGNLLRNYSHVLDIPSDFRIGEDAEVKPLLKTAWQTVLEQAYENPNPDVVNLLDNLGYGRDDRGVERAVMALYNGANCHGNPQKWMDLSCEKLDISKYDTTDETPWGAYLMAEFHRDLTVYRQRIIKAMADFAEEPAVVKAYTPAFTTLLNQVEELEKTITWQEIYTTLPADFGRLAPVRKYEDKEFLERLKSARAGCIDGLKAWREVFYDQSAAVLADLQLSASALRGGFLLTKQLMQEFGRQKSWRKLLDFGDLEHLAVKLLVDRDTGKATAVAREVSQRYAEILVDEYQDSNEIQDSIFHAISKNGENRFMVGDVKQSIYRFRLADPNIFLKKYHSYAQRDDESDKAPRKILLSENFRSRKEILSAVNHVFSTVMSTQVGDLDYTDEEALRAGATFPEPERPAVELHTMVPLNTEDKNWTKVETEAAFVAGRIATMIQSETVDGEKIQPKDIVILLRSVSSTAPVYMAALAKLGIPSQSERGDSILDSQEVAILVSLLEIIDNPHRDVALVTALSSPLFGFTADDLATIRSGLPRGDFYEALVAESGEKATAFLNQLSQWRELSRWCSLAELMQMLIEDTRAEGLFGAMENGSQRVENLRLLVETAVNFGAMGNKSLYQFCQHLRQMEAIGGGIVRPGTGGHGVTIMTIHKSKGLEFPVVFLSDLSHKINLKDGAEPVVTHPVLFASSNVLDKETMVSYPTLGKKAMAHWLRGETISEELRVLYVAMTRPKQRLIMTYCSKYLESELKAIAQETAMPVLPDFARRVKNQGAWVLMAAMNRTEAGDFFALGGYPAETVVYDHPWHIEHHKTLPQVTAISQEEQGIQTTVILPSPEELSREFAYTYPHAQAVELPTKLTPTQLKGRILDDEVMEQTTKPLVVKPLRRPRFIMEQGLTPTERGTANHLFLQFARYAQCTTLEDVQGEITRLVDQAFLTAEQGEAVESRQMVALFQSDFGQAIFQAEETVREFKFSLLMSAREFGYDAQEEIMLQGVVDCLLVNPEGLTIIDFKTDYVRPGGEAEKAGRYASQVEAYALALSQIYQLPVVHKTIYFLKTSQWVDMA